MAMTVNKGTGMSDAEWNDIVRATVKREKEESIREKAKVQKQRMTMRDGLTKQLAEEKELEQARVTKEKEFIEKEHAFAERKHS